MLCAAAPVAALMVVAVPSATSAWATTCPAAGVRFSAAFAGGVVKIGSAGVSRNVNGTTCGSLQEVGAPSVNLGTGIVSVNFNVNATAANTSFAPGTVVLFGLISAPQTVAIDGPLVGTATSTANIASVLAAIGANPDDPAFPATVPATSSETVSQPLTATVNLLGFKCSIGPFTPVLTTGTSGSLTGTTLTGPQNLTSLTATLTGSLVANTFAVPAIQSSSSCPELLAVASNLLLGLPLAAGKSSMQVNATLNAAGLPDILGALGY
jgi:hypothetical protein